MNDYRPYQVVEYDPKWRDIYKSHINKIEPILGNEILSVHHVGSTSIPGMWAKPNIDVMVVVHDISKIKQYRTDMELAGYVARGDYSKIDEEYFTEDLPSGERVASIHVFQSGNPEIKKHLDFRDYLTTNEDARNRYIKLKKQLVHDRKVHYRGYDDGKQKLISQLNKEAEAWASSSKLVSS